MQYGLFSATFGAAALLAVSAPHASASTETTLASFNGVNGANTFASLITVNGTFYGLSTNGGAFGKGTLFSMTPAGVITVLHDFGLGADGAYPRASLLYHNGTFYGTTYAGGSGAGCTYFGSCGTVFQMRLGGPESVLYNFQGGVDGSNPFGGLTAVGDKLFGTTLLGGVGSNGQPLACSTTYPSCGTIFLVTPSGSHSVLYSFKAGQDGANPFSTMLYAGNYLYGTAGKGGGACSVGAFGCGTVFRSTLSGAEVTVHKFTGGADGAFPYTSLALVGSQLYGTTFYGGPGNLGTIYTIYGPGLETVLHSFTGGADGAHPSGRLAALNGKIYGTATDGGTLGCTYYYPNPGCGTVFEFLPSTTPTAVTTDYDFQGGATDGGNPNAQADGMLVLGGDLYGTTYDSGAFNLGTVFKFTP